MSQSSAKALQQTENPNVNNLAFKYFSIHLNLQAFCSNSTELYLWNCPTLQTPCLLHYATTTFYFDFLLFSFQHWCLLLFSTVDWVEDLCLCCAKVSHTARCQVSCKVTIYPSRHLSFLPISPHYPSRCGMLSSFLYCPPQQ